MVEQRSGAEDSATTQLVAVELQTKFANTKLCTLSTATFSAACEAGEATTCTLSVAYGLGATRRSSVAFSDSS